MTTWIVLLRGINVGGNNIVRMQALRELLETNGFEDVKTYIQSGNIVLRAPERPTDIGRLIEAEFGFAPAVLPLSTPEFERAAAANPYATEAGNRVHLYFMGREPETIDHDLLEGLRVESEAYTILNQVCYLHAPNGIGRSKLAAKMERAFPGVALTARNLNTVNKLLDLIAETD